MTSDFFAKPRLSSHPQLLYQADRLSVGGPPRAGAGFYGHMLLDDLRKLRYAYKVSFVPKGLDLSRASELLFMLLNDFNVTGYDRDPAALVCDFVGELLNETKGGGALLVELHSLPILQSPARRGFRRQSVEAEEAKEQTEGDGPSALLPSLGHIPGWTVKETRTGYRQDSLAEQRTIRIPRARVQRLVLSRRNRSAWRQSVKWLQLVDANKTLEGGIERLSWEGYTFSEVVEVQNLSIAVSTAAIGWDGRGAFVDAVTSPYMTFRRLRFIKFWIEAVAVAVDFLNQFTTSEALYGNEAFSFSLGGLPTSAELARAMDEVRAGTLTVQQAHDAYLFPKYNAGGPDAESAN